ncbi:endonuclease/exonuclease/phosphatase family protein [Anaerobacterium chartisolvens]|uniref:Endonuclease/exonuclease/phosphatase family protein n=1 Tax=Anaerobacterium chartisolvens TaxID=1297424 RepID=A0A369BHX5_9FIRM|nr:endonuclease/exonuclease/phosphatase family protein [Anaerobacterium chartisolvens]RCX20057.1 endonuclease/exonuclease/phosphatase family protein [Anaerobacterium chartisolvens]
MHKIKNPFGSTLRILSVLWLIFMFFHVMLTGKVFLWSFFGSIPTFFFVIIPLAFLVCEVLGKKKNVLALFMAAISLVMGFTQLDINLFRQKGGNAASDIYKEIKIFNWNTECWDQNKDKDELYRFLKKQDADIYILQEYLYGSIDPQSPGIDKSRLFNICSAVPGFPPAYLEIDDTERMRKEFPGYYLAVNKQFVVISRFPIQASHADYSDQYSVNDIEIYGRAVRFFNVHMLLHIEPVNPFTRHFYETMERRYAARRIGFDNLRRDIENTSMPYFISGDFNSTKAMGVMDMLTKDNTDAVKYSDELIPLTFNFKGLKFWRFDYAFIPRDNTNIQIKEYKGIYHQGLSDHDGLKIVLRLNI